MDAPCLAAVLILIIEIDGIEKVMLTRRSSKLKSHPGQICFPGGKKDAIDATIVDTAIREAKEEVGLIDCQVIQILQPCISAHGLLVYPVLAKCALFEPILNMDEVEVVYYFDFIHFIQPIHYDCRDWDITTSKSYSKYSDQMSSLKSTLVRLHQFKINEIDTVWGLTSEFGIQAASVYYKQQPNFDWLPPQQLLHWWQVTRVLFTTQSDPSE